METGKLMLGDWIQIVPDAPVMPNECHRAGWIRTGEIGLDNRSIVPYPYIQPIPLTPDILEKNGFINGEFYAESHIEDWQIMSDGSHLAARSERGWCIDIPCQYVHELQHALRLCGIDKEIVL